MLRLKFRKLYSLPQKKNETINEDEMKQNIKTYLDYSGELYENIVPLSSAMSDEKVTGIRPREITKTNRFSSTKRCEFP